MGDFSKLDRFIREGEAQIKREKEAEERRLEKWSDDRNRDRLSIMKIEDMSFDDIDILENIRKLDHEKKFGNGYVIRKEQIDEEWMDQVLKLIDEIEPRLSSHPEIVPQFNEMLEILNNYMRVQEDDNNNPPVEVMGKKFKKSDAKILKYQIAKELKYRGMSRCDLRKKLKDVEEEIARREFLENSKREKKPDESLTLPTIEDELEKTKRDVIVGDARPKDIKTLEELKEKAKKAQDSDVLKMLELEFENDDPGMNIKKSDNILLFNDGTWYRKR